MRPEALYYAAVRSNGALCNSCCDFPKQSASPEEQNTRAAHTQKCKSSLQYASHVAGRQDLGNIKTSATGELRASELEAENVKHTSGGPTRLQDSPPEDDYFLCVLAILVKNSSNLISVKWRTHADNHLHPLCSSVIKTYKCNNSVDQ